MRLVLAVVVCASCTSSDSVTCDDGRICPAGTTCIELSVPAVAQKQCAPAGSVAACDGAGDFDTCTLGGESGACYPTSAGHTCLPAGCGNAITDPGEVCDDGNAIVGDGCSASCASNETCGNGVLDPVTGEHCDDGNLQSHDGCAADCRRQEQVSWTHFPVTSPSITALGQPVMAFDAAHRQVVLFGGTAGTNLFPATTWLFDGSGWAAID